MADKQSTLQSEHDLVTRLWKISENSIYSPDIEVEFRFVSDSLPIMFSDFSFGIIVQKTKDIVFHKSFPKVGTTYISTDQEVLERILIKLEHNTEYKVTFWVEDSGLKTEYIHTLLLPEVQLFPEYEVE